MARDHLRERDSGVGEAGRAADPAEPPRRPPARPPAHLLLGAVGLQVVELHGAVEAGGGQAAAGRACAGGGQAADPGRHEGEEPRAVHLELAHGRPGSTCGAAPEAEVAERRGRGCGRGDGAAGRASGGGRGGGVAAAGAAGAAGGARRRRRRQRRRRPGRAAAGRPALHPGGSAGADRGPPRALREGGAAGEGCGRPAQGSRRARGAPPPRRLRGRRAHPHQAALQDAPQAHRPQRAQEGLSALQRSLLAAPGLSGWLLAAHLSSAEGRLQGFVPPVGWDRGSLGEKNGNRLLCSQSFIIVTNVIKKSKPVFKK